MSPASWRIPTSQWPSPNQRAPSIEQWPLVQSGLELGNESLRYPIPCGDRSGTRRPGPSADRVTRRASGRVFSVLPEDIRSEDRPHHLAGLTAVTDEDDGSGSWPDDTAGYDELSMTRIKWVEDADATGAVASAFAQIRATSQSGSVADILRTMSLRPDFMTAINEASRLHFTDGALTRAQHELIAAYVAALNRCHY